MNENKTKIWWKKQNNSCDLKTNVNLELQDLDIQNKSDRRLKETEREREQKWKPCELIVQWRNNLLSVLDKGCIIVKKKMNKYSNNIRTKVLVNSKQKNKKYPIWHLLEASRMFKTIF